MLPLCYAQVRKPLFSSCKRFVPFEIVEEAFQFFQLRVSREGPEEAVEVDVGEFGPVDPGDRRTSGKGAKETVRQQRTNL